MAPLGAQSQDCIAAALACNKILKQLSREEEDTDSLEEMLALADEYEQRAIGEFPGPQPRLPAGHPGAPRPGLSSPCPGPVVWRGRAPPLSPAIAGGARLL